MAHMMLVFMCEAWLTFYLFLSPALAWRSQFSNDQADHFAGGASSDNGQAGVSQPAFSRPMMGMMGGGMGMGVGMMNSGYGMGQYGGFRPAMSSSAAQGSQTALDKGKSRFVELDDATWEEQFKRIDAEAESKGKGKGKAPEGDHALPSEEEQNAAIRNALEDLERDVADDGRESNNRFEELWNAMNKDHATGVPPSAADADLAQWEEELMRSRGGYSHPGGGLGAGDTGLNETAGFDGTEDALRELDGFGTVTADGYPRLGTYRFSEQNAFRDHPNPLAEGLRLMGNGGSLSDAALLFEVAAQREIVGPTGGEQGEVDRSRRERSEAWRRLGECQAMNERETQAIRALEEAVRIDEGNLEAYMVSLALQYLPLLCVLALRIDCSDFVSALQALAISYTNEGYDAAAHSTLERYMSRAYPHLKPSALPPSLQGNGDPLEGTGTHNPWAQLNRVTDLFLSAARQGASSGTIDPEVQVGLGVLYYSSAAYDQARDCFATALHARPNDFLLWNRLGATLANGGKPEEAIEAYHKALELRPTFTRAIYNLSVSCECRSFISSFPFPLSLRCSDLCH